MTWCANLGAMTESSLPVAEVLPALERTLAIIQDRGWSQRFSNGPDSELNVRSALSVACREGADGDAKFHRLYTECVGIIMTALGTGILNWETQASGQAEIEATLGEIIDRAKAGVQTS